MISFAACGRERLLMVCTCCGRKSIWHRATSICGTQLFTESGMRLISEPATPWCIYPMYDFTHCLSDSLEGITHSLCTLEFEDHRPLYDWFLDELGLDCHPQQIEFARGNLSYTVTSKR